MSKKEQFIHIDEEGNKLYYNDRKMIFLHREDGPAIEHANGGKHWYINGKHHREDGPACEYTNGSKYWYINGELHREDGPACEYTNGSKEWFISGKYHREDGPACEWADGVREWYINGKELTEKEFNARMNQVELTLEEIADKFDVSVDRLKIRK